MIIKKSHNLNWPYFPDHTYKILFVGGLGSRKTNVLLNLIKYQQPDIDNICLYVKDTLKSKFQLHINVREKVEIKELKNTMAFIEYSQTIDDVYENLENYNPTKKEKVFHDMIAEIEANKTLSPIFYI